MANIKPRVLIEQEAFEWQHPDKIFTSRCNLSIYKRNAGAVVIASESDELSPGVSVTNGAEHIATEIMRRLELSPNFVIWIEHSPVQVSPRWLHINR